jgi:hypothetical protein
MATTSPLARVKEEFGGKDKLVDKIVGLLDSGDESKDDLRKRLLSAANRKLIRLHGVATQVKSAGGKDQIASAAAQELGKGKDKDYLAKLSTYSSGKLVDILASAKKRNSRAIPKAPAVIAAKSAAAKAKRAPVKAPAKKKPGSK